MANFSLCMQDDGADCPCSSSSATRGPRAACSSPSPRAARRAPGGLRQRNTLAAAVIGEVIEEEAGMMVVEG
jgi:hypothetical protein